MQNKGKNLLPIIAAGICAVLVIVLNVIVLARGRVSLRGAFEEETETAEQQEKEQETEQETEQTVSADFEDFRLERNKDRERKKTEEEENAEDMDGQTDDYLCPDSIVRVLDEEDLEELKAGEYEGLPAGKSIIQMVINEIYARNGYKFEDEELVSYFSRKSWYSANAENSGDMDTIYEGMSEIDKANIDFLKDQR